MRGVTILTMSFLIFAIACNEKPKKYPPPLVDGNISDFIDLGIDPINLGDSVDLYIYQNQHYVWLGYTYPEGSYGLLDLEIISPKIEDTLRIHVSAQLGEWPSNNPDLVPQSPESELWWNMNGWIANEVWLNGTDRSGETPRYKFRNASAREMQMSKGRFGRGEWKMQLNITNIKGKNGEDYNILFPEDRSFYTLNVN